MGAFGQAGLGPDGDNLHDASLLVLALEPLVLEVEAKLTPSVHHVVLVHNLAALDERAVVVGALIPHAAGMFLEKEPHWYIG